MAGSLATMSLLVLALLPHSILGATLYGEGHTMRRERRAEVVQLSARGDIGKSSSVADGEEFCDYDFPLGFKDSQNCSASNHSHIVDEGMCVEAANQAGATAANGANGSFRLGTAWEKKFPKGCFKYECKEAANKICYFYNEGEPENKDVKGTPVCSRPKHTMGAANSNGGCPDGYMVLDDETKCSSAAGCLGRGKGTEFRKGQHDAGEHVQFPRGCFVDVDDGNVYYNGPSSFGTGSTVKGTPVCVVKVANPDSPPPPTPAPAPKPAPAPVTTVPAPAPATWLR